MRNGWMGAVALVACLFLPGCESDDAKLERLQSEAALARLSVAAKQERTDSLLRVSYRKVHMDSTAAARFDSVYWDAMDALAAAERRALLAERELNRFLR